jgi:hypothetical protein
VPGNLSGTGNTSDKAEQNSSSEELTISGMIGQAGKKKQGSGKRDLNKCIVL